mgnify:FL=1
MGIVSKFLYWKIILVLKSIEPEPPPPPARVQWRGGRTRGRAGTGHDWIPRRREGGREPSPRMGPENHHELITIFVCDVSRSN